MKRRVNRVIANLFLLLDMGGGGPGKINKQKYEIKNPGNGD